MSDSPDTASTPTAPSINVIPNGPLIVQGDLALYRRHAVHSEHGEPLAWVTTERLETRDRTGGSPDLNGKHRFSRFNPAVGLAWKASDQVTAYGGYAETKYNLRIGKLPVPTQGEIDLSLFLRK